jgi:hypothetical protein
LANHIQHDPDYLQKFKSTVRVSLESPSKSGGKMWSGVAMYTNVNIRWGKINTQGSLKTIVLSQCTLCNPALELKIRALKKLHEGYSIVQADTFLP